MPDFLTRRNGMWHFVRRVPAEFAVFDQRVIVRHSTKIKVATDRTGRRAIRVAEQLNAALQTQWLDQAGRKADSAAQSYDDDAGDARTTKGKTCHARQPAAGGQTGAGGSSPESCVVEARAAAITESPTKS